MDLANRTAKKTTGLVRRLDDLGRIVLPIELRRNLDIDVADGLEIFVDDEGNIILRKYEPACIFCGHADRLTKFKGKNICKNCVADMGL